MEKRKRDGYHRGNGGIDTNEQIQKCLNCKKEKCNNCLHKEKKK